jgi:predicted nucleic acid-binding Zn ribbon protein
LPGELPAGLAGPALARAVLDAANAGRPANRRRSPGGGEPAGKAAPRRRGWSGPGPDPRDPQPFGAALAKLLKDRGWQRPAAEATLFGRWEKVVGASLATHCRPVKLTDGELTVEAASTAWATQLRLLAGSLLKKIAAEVGHGVVTRMHIHGPAAPSWQRGPRRVRGRGPRDTYG